MKKNIIIGAGIALNSLFTLSEIKAQLTACPNGLMYSQTSPIQAFNPSLPLSATNPYTINVTGSSSGLAYGPNLNAASPSPTFYTIISGNYAYWNGTGWTSTGHSTGNSSAVNIGVGPGCLYNLVGGTGQVYVYNGTGPGTLLTTVSGFSGGGPYDLVVDNCCNFYIFKATAPQSLSAYSPTGALLGTCTMSGMPTTSSGIGFAIVGNQVVVVNSSGMFIGNVSGSAISFTNVPNIPGGGDVASCPIACGMCYTILPLNFKDFFCETSVNGTLLNWETALEEGVNFFNIERSTDGENFSVIGGTLANNYPSKYTFEDKAPVKGFINYYRIRGVEKFNSDKITNICSVKPHKLKISSSTLFPNPTNGEFSLNLDAEDLTGVIITIYDCFGKAVKKVNSSMVPGATKLDFNITDVRPGVYGLEISTVNNEILSVQKLIKID